MQYVEELEEAADHLRLLPLSVGLTSSAHSSLQSTLADVKAQADVLLRSAKRVYNSLQVHDANTTNCGVFMF